MKKILFVGLLGIAMMACNSRSSGYKIEGNIAEAGNGKAILLFRGEMEKSVGGDTVVMKDGKFIFTGKLKAPASALVKIWPEKAEPASFGFIAENSVIKLEGDWRNVKEQYKYRNLENVVIRGSLNNDVYEEVSGVYGEMLKLPEFKEYAEIQQKLSELRQTDVEAFYKLENETEKLAGDFQQAVLRKQLEVIRKNKSVESSVLYLRFLWNDMSLDELKQVFQVLDSNVQNSPMAANVREEIAVREKVKPGMPAPDFSLETPDGSRLALSDLKGKYVILDFWASWCRPCRASFPEMKKLYAEYKDKGLEILGITNDSRKADWLKALDEDQLPWKQVIDEFPIQRKPAKVATLYAIPYLPTLILIAPDGTIVGQAKDKHQLAEWLAERL